MLYYKYIELISTKTLILCTHGIDKKTNKTPQTEIEKAIKIKHEYLKNKT